MLLGIDIGGTSVKFGSVSAAGVISGHKKFSTAEWIQTRGFLDSLKEEIGNYLTKYPGIKRVGMGFPGLLSADRRTVILLPNIPSVKNAPVLDVLEAEFPHILFRIENDAKCAALGEMLFGSRKDLDNFILVTLGTGVGSGVIINKKIFLGGRGNATEIGHILINSGKTLEQHLGLHHLVSYARELMPQYPDTLLKKDTLSPRTMYEAALKNDALALYMFGHVGQILGEAMISVMRMMDINTILLGGGISGAHEFFVPRLKSVVAANMPPYYSDTMTIGTASLSNDAGILGAASLVKETGKIVA